MCQVCSAFSATESNVSTDQWHVSGSSVAPPDYNGNSATAGKKGLSGDQRIDGLLYGISGANNNFWTSAITYSFPDNAGDYGVYTSDADMNGTSAQNQGFSQFSASQQAVTHFALNTGIGPAIQAAFSVEGFTDLVISTAADPSGGNSTMRFANSSDAGTAYAYRPGTYIQAGDSFYGTNASVRDPDEGTYGWMTTLHEIGHAVGLKHGHEGDSFAGNPTVLPSATDSHEYSLMTYRSYAGAPTNFLRNGQYDFPQTFMMHDIAALQYLYGADFTANAGNTIYKWNPTAGDTLINGTIAIDMANIAAANRIFATIWDGSGFDTYDLSSYTTNLNIDLQPGGISKFSDVQRANLGDGNFATGNIYNALLFQGNLSSLIEAAIGGTGNDTLYGNQGGNVLNGGSGNDTLWGRGGDDLYYGGLGDDTFLVEQAGDVIVELFGQGNDVVYVIDVHTYTLSENIEVAGAVGTTLNIIGNSGANTLVGNNFNNILNGADGNDIIYGVAGNNSLIGGGGNDSFVSGSGVDSMSGGIGDDVYFIGNGDLVFENFGEGIDTVWSSFAIYFMTANVEVGALSGGTTLFGHAGANTLIGDGNFNVLSGLGGSDFLIGGGGGDILIGGDGFDVMQGGTGGDTFWWQAMSELGDMIQDWVKAEDQLQFTASAFFNFAGATLVNGINFIASTNPFATTANATFLWDTDDTNLFFDPDGNGAAGAILVVDLQAFTTLDVTDFQFV